MYSTWLITYYRFAPPPGLNPERNPGYDVLLPSLPQHMHSLGCDGSWTTLLMTLKPPRPTWSAWSTTLTSVVSLQATVKASQRSASLVQMAGSRWVWLDWLFIYISRLLPSNQGFCKEIACKGRGVGHRVGRWWKGSWANKIVAKTSLGCIRPCISCTPIKVLQLLHGTDRPVCACVA